MKLYNIRLVGLFIVTSILTSIVITCYAYADSDESSRWISRSVGVKAGYGFSFNDEDEEIQMVGVFPHIRWALNQWSLGENSAFQLDFYVEGTLVQFVKPRGNVGFGIAPIFRGAFVFPRVTPYVLVGLGVFYTDLDVLVLGQEFNFTIQSEGGLEFPINNWIAFNIAYRYFHVSNANTNKSNLGLNVNMGVAGVTFAF